MTAKGKQQVQIISELFSDKLVPVINNLKAINLQSKKLIGAVEKANISSERLLNSMERMMKEIENI